MICGLLAIPLSEERMVEAVITSVEGFDRSFRDNQKIKP
jgi:hypothetical protein